MIRIRIWFVILIVALSMGTSFAKDSKEVESVLQPFEPLVGSWAFSGMVSNESGERFGYFFQMRRQGADFYAKTALIDGQTNKLILFYEGNATIDQPKPLNWRVGRSFIRYNPINDSWIFGLKVEDNKGFNFKVDMLKQANKNNENLVLRPGVEFQVFQTSSLNGHIQTGKEDKEQFVTGNNAWFGKLWFSKTQKISHDIGTVFCRLSNDNGFFSANLKEPDATSASVSGWRDDKGNKVRMSQFISIKSLADNQSLLIVGSPKLKLKLYNTLEQDSKIVPSIAGFSKENPKGFCFITQQTFLKLDPITELT